jgi:hypothetical protein
MSHRDRTDLGTHLSLGENRGSYVRATDSHLSLRSFRDNNSQSTLPLREDSVNRLARLGGADAPNRILPLVKAQRITHLSDFSKLFAEYEKGRSPERDPGPERAPGGPRRSWVTAVT